MAAGEFHDKVIVLFVGAVAASLAVIGIVLVAMYARHEAKRERDLRDDGEKWP